MLSVLLKLDLKINAKQKTKNENENNKLNEITFDFLMNEKTNDITSKNKTSVRADLCVCPLVNDNNVVKIDELFEKKEKKEKKTENDNLIQNILQNLTKNEKLNQIESIKTENIEKIPVFDLKNIKEQPKQSDNSKNKQKTPDNFKNDENLNKSDNLFTELKPLTQKNKPEQQNAGETFIKNFKTINNSEKKSNVDNNFSENLNLLNKSENINNTNTLNNINNSKAVYKTIEPQIEQTLTYLKKNNQNTIKVDLQPEYLGNIVINMKQSKNDFKVEIMSKEHETHQILQQNQESLKDLVINLKKMDSEFNFEFNFLNNPNSSDQNSKKHQNFNQNAEEIDNLDEIKSQYSGLIEIFA